MKARWIEHRDALLVAGVALAARLAIVLWAANRVPPAADGAFYHIIATRIAAGHGYTWLWPDGVVTYAAHYPVGYPALLGGLYALFGAHAWLGMVANALLGTLAAVASHTLARSITTPRRALAIGWIVALHVALVPYTAALMTEGVVASLWILAVLVTMFMRRASGHRRVLWLLVLGMLLGIASLVRPQTLLLVLPLGWMGTSPEVRIRKRMASAAGVLVVASLVIAPWVLRNQIRMGEAGVSFNGGWNLLIGATPSAKGTFAPLEVPESCREEFDEAKKDRCFGRVARERIVDDPLGWLALAPHKLSATFDYCGAAGWYLHEANPEAFPYRAKLILGSIETVFVRIVLLAALLGMGLAPGPRRKVRMAVALLSALALFSPYAWPSFVGLLLVLLLQGRWLGRVPVALSGSAAILAVTIVSHLVFFGAGRYAMVVFPTIATLAGGIRRED